MTPNSRKWSMAVLGAVPAMIFVGALLVHPIAQNPGYHDFADQRTIWGIANFWNVVSNAAFLVTAAFGLRALRSTSAFTQIWERNAYWILLAGTVFVAFGSAYYHFAPNSQTLFWDRLPMTIVFMSLFATTIGERIDMRSGQRSLLPLLLIGVASVVYWRISGDLRFYAMVQFYPMLMIPVLLIWREPRYSSEFGTWAMIGLYACAKALELFDRELSHVFTTGGHPLKHLCSAAALACYVIAVGRRRNLSADRCLVTSVKSGMVDGMGLEPTTPALRTRCSPN
jgi:hypothetical protein